MDSKFNNPVRSVQCRLWLTPVMLLSDGQWVTQRETSKLRDCFSFNEPKVKFSMGYFHHGLWLYAPVSAHAHHVLLVYTLPLPPRAPDSALQAQTQTNHCVSKLLSPLRQTFPLISIPFPEEVSVCPLMPVRQQLSTCRVTGQVPVKVTAVGSLREEDRAQVHTAAKTTTSSPPGKMWRWHLNISNIEYFCRMLESWKCLGKTSSGPHWLLGGLTWLHLTLH